MSISMDGTNFYSVA